MTAPLATQDHVAVPVVAPLATWTPTFAIAVDEAIERKAQKDRFFKRVMIEGVHYGIIPGTDKPTLLKPGAEMLLANMGLNPSYSHAEPGERDMTGEHHGGEMYIRYQRKCTIYRQLGQREDERMKIAEADGSCSSWETKYRYRNDSMKCPQCGAGAIIKGKPEYGGGWVCFKKKNGCGANFAASDPAITSQPVGRIPNPDLADLDNTILKMADKRALVAATLLATGCSDIFTQDVEDLNQSSNGAAPVVDAKFTQVEQPKAPPPSIQDIAAAFKQSGRTGSLMAWITEHIAPDMEQRKKKGLLPDEAREAFRLLNEVEEAQIKPQDDEDPFFDLPEAPVQTTALAVTEGPKERTPAPQQQKRITELASMAQWSAAELETYIENVTMVFEEGENPDGTLTVKTPGKRTVFELTAAEARDVYEKMAAEIAATP